MAWSNVAVCARYKDVFGGMVVFGLRKGVLYVRVCLTGIVPMETVYLCVFSEAREAIGLARGTLSSCL